MSIAHFLDDLSIALLPERTERNPPLTQRPSVFCHVGWRLLSNLWSRLDYFICHTHILSLSLSLSA